MHTHYRGHTCSCILVVDTCSKTNRSLINSACSAKNKRPTSDSHKPITMETSSKQYVSGLDCPCASSLLSCGLSCSSGLTCLPSLLFQSSFIQNLHCPPPIPIKTLKNNYTIKAIMVSISNPHVYLLTTCGLSKFNQAFECPAVGQYHSPVELDTTTALV